MEASTPCTGMTCQTLVAALLTICLTHTLDDLQNVPSPARVPPYRHPGADGRSHDRESQVGSLAISLFRLTNRLVSDNMTDERSQLCLRLLGPWVRTLRP